MSGLVNKIKDAVHGDKHHSSSNDPASAKGHDSKVANKVDPRIDSDRDGRANPANTTGGLGSNTASTGTYGSGTTGSSTLGGDNYGTSGTGISGAPGGTTGTSGLNTSSNRGPHDSNLANKVDPRVDSDRDHRANPASNVGSTGGEFGSSRTTGTGEFGSTTRSGAEYGSSGLNTSSNRGPHDSNLANKADPRVDSDRDHRANPASNTGAYGTTGTTGTHGTSGLGSNAYGTTGTHGTSGLGSSNTYGNTSTNAGPHSSNLANKADPRVDSDRDHRANPASNTGAYGSSTTGTTGVSGLNNPGPAPNTAGPHSKDILNKVDPRVDSDRDGSKTVGQDQTYARSSNTTAHKDPTDAAQVPPSVLAKHIGEPSLEHGDVSHDRARRNSTTTHQEAHRGL